MVNTVENFRDIGLRYWGEFEDISVGLVFSAMDAEIHLAVDELGIRRPYELETSLTDGKVENLFDIKDGSNFRIDVVVFSDEGQRAEYLRLKEEWNKSKTVV